MKKKYYLGIDIGGTKCSVIAGNERMDILHKIQFRTETHKGPDYTLDNLCKNAATIVNKFSDYALVSIGISCGGPLDSKRGLILSPPNLPGWNKIPVVKIFKEKFSVPVLLQNDANACALAEWKFGAGAGTENMIFLTFGTGLGAGLILNSRLYTGTNDMAGEVGHIRMADSGPIGYGKSGSLEGFCSGYGIAQLAQRIILQKMENGEKISYIDNERQLENITTKDLAEAANKGDKTALEIFEISGRYLGAGLSILIDIINPQRIVIGSVYARNPHLFNATCMDVIAKEALRDAADVCDIVPAALGDQVGDYASLCVAMMNT